MSGRFSNGQDAPWAGFIRVSTEASGLDGERQSPVMARPTAPSGTGRGVNFTRLHGRRNLGDKTMNEQTEGQVIGETRRTLLYLTNDCGIPAAEVLAVMQAEILLAIVGLFGPAAASDLMARAARRLEALPLAPTELSAHPRTGMLQ